MNNIYLDSAATTPVRKEVLDAMMPYLTDAWQNPNSLYKDAVNVRNAVENARLTVASSIGADPKEIIFTSSGSESNCMAILGFVRYWQNRGYSAVVITSSVEHDSILDLVHDLDCEVKILPVQMDGAVDMSKLIATLSLIRNSSMIDNKKVIVSIQTKNNETGAINPMEEICYQAHKYGAVLHTDAVQALPSYTVTTDYADMISLSGHKIGAPKGIGVLYKSKDIKIAPIIYGTQNFGYRGGTENVPYIVGLAKAFELNMAEADERNAKLLKLRNALIDDLFQSGIKYKVNGFCDNIVNITFLHNVSGEGLIYLLDAAGIQVSAGSACNSHEEAPSHVLKAMGVSDEDAMRTLRITLSDRLVADDIHNFVRELKKDIELLSEERIGD